MIEPKQALAINRKGWDRVAPKFHGGTALPEYGPLAPTEDTLRLLELEPGFRALELGCGSGHSLRYLAERGAGELWGIDPSSVQIAYAQETLEAVGPPTRLFEAPMESNPGVPRDHFDLVFSLWGLGWTVDLTATLAWVAESLRPGGCFLFSGEHPAYSCVEWNGSHFVASASYCAEAGQLHDSWMGGPIVIYRRTVGTMVTQIAKAGLRIEELLEPTLAASAGDGTREDPARWYSNARARLVPTTFIIKACKP